MYRAFLFFQTSFALSPFRRLYSPSLTDPATGLRGRKFYASPVHSLQPAARIMGRGISSSLKKSAKKEQQLSPQDREAMLNKASLISKKLMEVYPKAPKGFLDHADPFTLLIGVLLSAQSLDIKVNEVTPELFRLGGTPDKMIQLGADKVQSIIKIVGLSKQKAKNIVKLSEILCNEYNGQVPETFEGLERLPGVGHKTASVVMIQAFGKPAFPVDTHVHRLACRWGCGDAKSVEKTESTMKLWFPEEDSWADLHTRLIMFGREHCPARKHDIDQCVICSFAATDEARKANADSPLKFVAATSHKFPYSIRNVDALAANEGIVKKEGSVVDVVDEKSTKSRRKKGMVEEKVEAAVENQRKSNRGAKVIKGSYLDEDGDDSDGDFEMEVSGGNVTKSKKTKKIKPEAKTAKGRLEPKAEPGVENQRKSRRSAKVIKGTYAEEEDDDEDRDFEIEVPRGTIRKTKAEDEEFDEKPEAKRTRKKQTTRLKRVRSEMTKAEIDDEYVSKVAKLENGKVRRGGRSRKKIEYME